MVTGGSNKGRAGTLVSIAKHPSSFHIVHLIDAKGSRFATRISNVMVVGNGKHSVITLFKDKGVKLSIIAEKKAKGKFTEY